MKKSLRLNFRLLISIAIFLASCNNPLHRPYNPATYEEDMQAIRKTNKVSDDDLQILAKYVMLARLSGRDITGISYDDMLDQVKTLQENNSELTSRNAIEKEAKRKRLLPFLEVSLQNKTYTKKNNKNVLIFTILFKNTGTQKIKTLTGDLTINDLMEKPVKNIPVFLDEDMLPGQTLTKLYTNDYNDADENDRRMRSKDFFDIRAIWNPEKIIFDNGKLAE